MIPAYYSENVNTTQPATTQSADLNTLWLNVIMNDSAYWLKQFRAMKSMNINSILVNSRYTLAEKFNKILGPKYKDLFPNVDKMSVSVKVLGDIFSDIGNFFSGQNLSQIEQGIRQGGSITDQIANALNYLRNMNTSNITAEQQKLLDLQNKSLSTVSKLFETYKVPLFVGGGLLVFYLLMRKK